MFKKTLLAPVFGMMATSVMAADITLPAPDKSSKATLMTALNNRHSDRAFANKELGNSELSTILWVAYGVNRQDGKRTIPTAMNQKDLAVYVFKKDGIYLYDAEANRLKQTSQDNKLSLFNKQDYMANVPAILVYVASDNGYGALHAGAAVQNVGLYTATNDMASIVRGFFDADEVAKALNLKDGQRVIVSQAIGWKK